MEILLFWLILSLIPAAIALPRGRRPLAWLFIGLLFTPLLALILVLLLPSKTKDNALRKAQLASLQPRSAMTPALPPNWQEPKSVPTAAGDPALAHWGEKD